MTVADTRPPTLEDREREIVLLLQRLWAYSMTTKSDESRQLADAVAEAASRGLITTEVVLGSGLYGRLWKVTPRGLVLLYHHTDTLSAEVKLYVENHCLHKGSLVGPQE